MTRHGRTRPRGDGTQDFIYNPGIVEPPTRLKRRAFIPKPWLYLPTFYLCELMWAGVERPDAVCERMRREESARHAFPDQ